MKRRAFMMGLGSVVAWPVVARAQQGDRTRRIGVLIGLNENDPGGKTWVSAFTRALADLGWAEGRNVRMDLRWGGGDNNRIRALAQDLVGLQPDVIATSATAGTVALQRERGRSLSSLRAWAIPSPPASSSGSTARVGTSQAFGGVSSPPWKYELL
jgi:putative ABC transport system substrate-binding protein